MRVRQDQLNFLRGLAATYVLANHARGAFFIGGEKLLSANHSIGSYLSVAMLQLTSLGAEMVILFFVLSGFAMAHSVAHTRNVGRFYLKRLLRIWPPYVAATLFAAVVGLIVGKTVPLTVALYIRPSTLLTPQFWSLPYEVLFYLSCPFIIGRRLLPTAIVATLATLVLRGPLLNPWSSLPVNFLGNELLLFAIGVTAFHHFERIPKVSQSVLLACIVMAFAATWSLKHLLGGTNLYANLVVAGVTVLSLRNLPENLPFNFGFFSYSIYIFSYALIALAAWVVSPIVDPAAIANPFWWILVVPPVLLLSYGLYWLVERPCNEVVAKLRSGSSREHEAVLQVGTPLGISPVIQRGDS